MRLLDTSAITLREFHGHKVPDYAILSHTWGEEEVSYQELGKAESRYLAGYSKIAGCCALAKSQGLEYVWIDTCCIDKTSSAELSEAINSMFRWYRDAQVCYAYFADVGTLAGMPLDPAEMESFRRSRWFTRGWTLQELLASRDLVFYDRDWKEIGTRQALHSDISIATGISQDHIINPMSASAAQKMFWASKRHTTRIEDMSYCLMGLFDVNMPLLYGEGA
ncbi:hypothetical protein P7C71_g3882, partial [Lecanoromycetidae sp. Uapishka_2]